MPLSFYKRPGMVVVGPSGSWVFGYTGAVVLAAIEAGADVIELGVPFSDPVADGPVIQRASERALTHGTCLAQVLALAAEVRQQAQSTGLVVFSYLNPILRMGMEKFCMVARHAGVDGVLVTDLPVEEAGEYLRAMKINDLAPVFLAAPTSPDARLKRIAEASRGFVYAVSRTGVTGARQQLASDAQKLVRRFRRISQLPVGGGVWVLDTGEFWGGGKFSGGGVGGGGDVGAVGRDRGRGGAAGGGF